ncbi:YegP family protein [Arthrobacter sp. KNU-44]|uniref:YegP family protein n=1 Tax=unclassified Arthrobacter TaxID=235627 RepID=UPI003F43FC73
MTGMFELFIDEDTSFRFRLKAPDGTVVAVSKSFPDKRAAVCGISDVREYAGMGLITDLCPEVPLRGPAPTPPAPVVRQTSPSAMPPLPAPPRHHGPLPQRDRTRPWHTPALVDHPAPV